MDDILASIQVGKLALSDWLDGWVNMFSVNLLWWLSWITILLGPPGLLFQKLVVVLAE